MTFWLPWDVESVTLNRSGGEESRPANRTKIWGEPEAIHKEVAHDKRSFCNRRYRLGLCRRPPRTGLRPKLRCAGGAGELGGRRRDGGRGRQREEGRFDGYGQRRQRRSGAFRLSFVEARVRLVFAQDPGNGVRARGP